MTESFDFSRECIVVILTHTPDNKINKYIYKRPAAPIRTDDGLTLEAKAIFEDMKHNKKIVATEDELAAIFIARNKQQLEEINLGDVKPLPQY